FFGWGTFSWTTDATRSAAVPRFAALGLATRSGHARTFGANADAGPTGRSPAAVLIQNVSGLRQGPAASNRLRPAVPTCYHRRRHLGGSPHARHKAAGVRHTARRC